MAKAPASARRTSAELVAALRHRLTDGFFTDYEGRLTPEDGLKATRGWRNEMWKLVNDVEQRLCPQPPKGHAQPAVDQNTGDPEAG